MLEGRAHLTSHFLEFARNRQHTATGTGTGTGTEPKLALTIGAYAREHLVMAVPPTATPLTSVLRNLLLQRDAPWH